MYLVFMVVVTLLVQKGMGSFCESCLICGSCVRGDYMNYSACPSDYAVFWMDYDGLCVVVPMCFCVDIGVLVCAL